MSKKSPLKVTMTCGLVSRMRVKNRRSSEASSGSLKVSKMPSYSGFGVYSRGSMSAETSARFTIKKPDPSTMMEMRVILSCAESGNFSGSFVHSMSHAKIRKPGLYSISGRSVTVDCVSQMLSELVASWLRVTWNHFPQLILLSMQILFTTSTSCSKRSSIPSIAEVRSFFPVPSKAANSSFLVFFLISESRFLEALFAPSVLLKESLMSRRLRPTMWSSMSRSSLSTTSA
mmetsp:Transcript_119533/g.334789  ORF Transcript_119533/g.334789 Transcript_119533/m.334789 type:complete len:231 (-) Transcript_119533:281-973(-)